MFLVNRKWLLDYFRW